MSIPEIIARYVRGHGLAVSVLPDSTDQAALEDGRPFQDDLDMFSEERQQMFEAFKEQEKSAEPEPDND